jgi:hypothetical protein
MVQTGLDIMGIPFRSPLNTHVSHAFYLNCRKLADFFQNKIGPEKDDIPAEHFVPGFKASLPISENWRTPINKQLAHVTYFRDTPDVREITKDACRELYAELKDTWRKFRKGLVGTPYANEFTKKVRERKEPHANGELSEFRFYDLD